MTDPAAPLPDPQWNPSAADDLEVQRLKQKCASTFAKHAQGRGLEAALGILLKIASSDGLDGRPRVNTRTRRLAALDYCKLQLAASTLNDRRGSVQAPQIPTPNPEAGSGTVAVVSIREVEAILATDDGLRSSIDVLQRAARHAGRLRLGAQRGQMEDGSAP